MKKIFLAFVALTMCFQLSYAAFPTNETKKANEDSTTVAAKQSFNEAVAEYKKLSRSEKRERKSEMKQAIKQYKADKKAGKEPSTNTLLLVILAILLPPLAVYLHEGTINGKFWLSLLLTLLFFLPGIIYALIVVLD